MSASRGRRTSKYGLRVKVSSVAVNLEDVLFQDDGKEPGDEIIIEHPLKIVSNFKLV